MAEHEELHDDDVIVEFEGEDGEILSYREEMVLTVGADQFAVLVELTETSENEFEEAEDATIAKIITDEEGKETYIAPTDEEFEAVRRAYEELLEDEEEE
ncbi:DUF1292 domain-containing protein [uncultured Selenomonas sp.]|uniref:DUF1292 domain-containing protein n=1 Tax=uncultured Selenomonas sp. TaxID=159275 RepID=UPI0028DCF090|nr:DUF1292 domain-containing protein [uncultured Selenomonas sp.]